MDNDVSPCSLLALPAELLELILSHLGIHDLNSFCRSSWRCHRLTFAQLFDLYKRKKKHCCLDWAARYGRVETFARVIREGINACHFFHLIKACIYNSHTNVVRVLLTQQRVLDGWRDIKLQGHYRSPGNTKVTPLSEACDRSEESLVEGMIDLLLATDEGRADLALSSVDGRQDALPAICVAARRNHVRVVRKLLVHGAYVNSKDVAGETPLMHAMNAANRSMVDLLLERGADPEIPNLKGQRVLPRAAYKGIELVHPLLQRGVSINQADEDGKTAIMEAVRGGHDALVSLLLDLGASVTNRRADGTSALHEAVLLHRCTAETMRKMIDAGLDVNWRSIPGGTVLHEAVRGFAPSTCIAFLLDAGADPYLHRSAGPDTSMPNTLPLEELSFLKSPQQPASRAIEILNLFLQRGFDLHTLRTPLGHCIALKAIFAQRTDILDFLNHNIPRKVSIDANGNLFHCDVCHATPLVIKHARKPTTLVSWCIQNGMSVRSVDDAGMTLLHRLLNTYAEPWIAKVLIEHGLDVNATDNKDNTALHLACTNHYFARWTSVLIKTGADLNARNGSGLTALKVAKTGGNDRAVKVLKRFMCNQRREKWKLIKRSIPQSNESVREIWDDDDVALSQLFSATALDQGGLRIHHTYDESGRI